MTNLVKQPSDLSLERSDVTVRRSAIHTIVDPVKPTTKCLNVTLKTWHRPTLASRSGSLSARPNAESHLQSVETLP
jgi:hypothetical protein